MLSLTRQLQAEAAERAALEREAERLTAALRGEKRALEQLQAKKQELEEAHERLQQSRREQLAQLEEETQRLGVLAAKQDGKLALLAQQQAAAERLRSKLEDEVGAARAALEAEQRAWAALARERVELLQQGEQARVAEAKARESRARAAEAAERDGSACAEAQREAEEARKAAVVAAQKRAASKAMIKVNTQNAEKHTRLLAEAENQVRETEKQARETKAALTHAEGQVGTTSRAHAKLSAKLAQAQYELASNLRSIGIKHRECAAFCNSRRDAYEAQRVLLRSKADQARAGLADAFAAFAVEQGQVEKLFAKAEETHANITGCTTLLRNELHRRTDELAQLRDLEVERWEGYARRHAQERASLVEMARSRVGLHQALSNDRAAITRESAQIVSLRLCRRREIAGWVRLHQEAEGWAVLAAREARRQKAAQQQADSTVAAATTEGAAADALELEVALLRRESAKLVGMRGVLEARAEKWRQRLRLERAALGEVSRRASRAASERRAAAQQARSAVEDKQRAEAGLAAERLELERLARATAGVEAAKAETAACVRLASEALAGARWEHEEREAQARAQERALDAAWRELEAARGRGAEAAAMAAKVEAQVVESLGKE